MPLRRLAWIAICAVLLVSMLPASETSAKPSQSRVPFTVTADTHADYFGMAVDGNGTGYFVWDTTNGTYNNPLKYCRVPRGATKCDVTETFDLKNFADGHPQVLLPSPGEVVLTTYRCCDGALYAITSDNGGKTFGAPRVIGTVSPYQTMLGPGEGTISVVDGPAVTEGIHYQATSPTGLTDLVANVGADVRRSHAIRLGPGVHRYQHADCGLQQFAPNGGVLPPVERKRGCERHSDLGRDPPTRPNDGPPDGLWGQRPGADGQGGVGEPQPGHVRR